MGERSVTHHLRGIVGRVKPAIATSRPSRAEDYLSSGRRGPPGRFGFEDISGLPWIEIDFPENVVKATALAPLLAS